MLRWFMALMAVCLGFAVGLGYGWYVSPVKYVDTTPASLREDYQADYVLMLAERFHVDHDLESARQGLALFGGLSPAEICAQAIAFARRAPYSAQDLQLLEEMHRALRAPSPAPTLPEASP